MPKVRIAERQRAIVSERAYHCCEYCWSQADYATERFSIEHILAKIRGGSNSLDNLALACAGCNSHKYAKTQAVDPLDGLVVPLYNPRLQQWSDHFRWNDDYALILGMSPTGRATVETLQLNRPSVVNLRRALYLLGQHPPVVFRVA